MNKNEYLKQWAQEVQQKVWQREVFITLKEKEGKKEEVDTLIFNNKKDQEVIDYINENCN